MATVFCCASSRFQKIASKSNRVLSTRRCTAWSIRAGSPANGASRKTSGKRNITGWRRASANCKRKPKSGIAWRTSLQEFCKAYQRKYEDMEPDSVVDARGGPAFADGTGDGCGV